MTSGCDLGTPLREAEKQLAIAVGRMGKMQIGGMRHWVGSWGDYRTMVRLMLAVSSLANKVQIKQARTTGKELVP